MRAQSARLRPRMRGRAMASSSAAEIASRSDATPGGPTRGKSWTAKAAPSSWESSADSTRDTAPARPPRWRRARLPAGLTGTVPVRKSVTPPTLRRTAYGCEMPTCTRLCLRRMTMELRHLHCFLAIAEEGTLTRAATRLHLTQPVVSRTLRQLEDHLRVRLVDRSTHHLVLTAAGHSFRIRAASAVAAADTAFDPAQLGVWPLRLGHAWSAFGEFTVSLLRS